MNTRELARFVSDMTGASEQETKAVIDAAFAKISSTVAAGEDVTLTGFGRFGTRDCAPRVGRNPRTGELMSIAASRKITFSAGKRMKEALSRADSEGDRS